MKLMMHKKNNLLLLALVVFFIFTVTLIAEAEQKKYIIMIDPAHGGEDSGVKLTDKVGEKDITLSIALALQKEIAKERNFEVVLSRDSDKTVSMEERKKIRDKIKPDILLSLHINSGFGKNASGFELYYPGLKNLEEQKKQTKKSAKDSKTKYLNDSIRLAQIIQKNMDSLFPRKGRGLREADPPILEGSTIPALSIEIGFATNAEEKKRLLAANTQIAIAQTLAKSIKTFFQVGM
jgi:N-acetylmuramoyl-L-alanine amidase